MRAAEALLALASPEIGPAAFHCQQVAEKMAKAALIAAREPPPRLHDIDELGEDQQRRSPERHSAYRFRRHKHRQWPRKFEMPVSARLVEGDHEPLTLFQLNS